MTNPQPGQSNPAERRLAAVVFTDIAGYSARMQRDEVGTLALVRIDFARIETLCMQHGGSVLNRMGDGMLLCFSSAVQAVVCALQVQAEFGQRKRDVLPEQCLEHRIGIHLGDIFLDGNQVAGDGINIAARLQTRAVPGGICISQTVRDTVKGKISAEAVSLGAQHFKNIAEAISVFHLAPEGGPAAPAVAAAAKPARARWKLAAAVAFVLAVGAALYFKLRLAGVAEPLAGGRPAIAVLPFANVSDDQSNAFFADGVHEDILANLANLDDFKIISRTSVMPFRGTKKSLREIAAALKVTHVLEGSVRRTGRQVRLIAQLIDARSDDNVWAQTFDRELHDVFAIQSEIATKVAHALRAALAPRELRDLARLATKHVGAYDSFQQARDVFRRGDNLRDLVARAQPFLERAVELDPNYAVAWAELGRLHVLAYRDIEGSAARLARAKSAIDRARQIAPDEPAVLLALADYQAASREFEPAIAGYRWIIAGYPNNVDARAGLSEVTQRLGNWSEALSMLREARVLDPHGPATLSSLTDLLVRLRRYGEAQATAREATALLPASALREYVIALIPFYARGDTAAIHATLAKIPAEARRTDHNAIIVHAQWAFARGDAGEVIRLWQESGPRWRFSFDSARFDGTAVAAAYLARGDAAGARPLLERGRDQLAAAAVQSPRNALLWSDLALTHAMLGEKSAALESAAKARDLVAGLPDVLERTACAADLACVQAWVGDKERAIAELEKVLKQPGSATFANVHELKHSLRWRPLQSEPAFLALLADPANNAPLL